MESYDFSTGTWQYETEMPSGYEVTSLSAAQVSDTEILLVGGRLDSGVATGAVYLFDTVARAFELVGNIPGGKLKK